MGRKAAEHGDHSVLFSDAMIDNRIVVTLDQQDGKSVLAEGGTGRVISKSGSLMTLTAKVAELCGFENPISFSRSFHRHVGLSPTAYRESDSPPPLDELSLGK